MPANISHALYALLLSQTPADDISRILSPFQQCSSIQNPSDKLACFEVALEKEEERLDEIEQNRKKNAAGQFGLPDRQNSIRENNPHTEDKVETTLKDVFLDQAKKRVFLLENGQVWKEMSNSTLRVPLHAGTLISIQKGGIGGYRLRADEKTGYVAVSRIQ